MNVFQYTAINNPDATRRLVSSYGINPENSVLSKQLATVIARDRDNGLDKLRAIHPDLSLFQDELDTLKTKIKSEFESKKQEYLNADGQSLKKDVENLKNGTQSKDESKSKQELMIIGGVIIIGLAIIFKNN